MNETMVTRAPHQQASTRSHAGSRQEFGVALGFVAVPSKVK